MDNEDKKKFESVYSSKVRAGRRRTYFFDVKKTKGEDFYITLTESTKRFDGDGYDRHKIFLYKEDFNRFVNGLQDTVDHVKKELMPDYDYEQFERRQEEWEKQKAEDEANGITPEQRAEIRAKERAAKEAAEAAAAPAAPVAEATTEAPAAESAPQETKPDESVESEDDMAW